MDHLLVGVAFAVVSFAFGLWLAMRFAPALAATREGLVAAWVVRLLAAGATCVLVLRLYSTIESLHLLQAHGQGLGQGINLAVGVAGALLGSGALLAGAALVYLLAPTDQD